jgi:hypothetical protein
MRLLYHFIVRRKAQNNFARLNAGDYETILNRSRRISSISFPVRARPAAGGIRLRRFTARLLSSSIPI